jgi:hypothetical protein
MPNSPCGDSVSAERAELEGRLSAAFCKDCIGRERGCGGCCITDITAYIDELGDDLASLTTERDELKAERDADLIKAVDAAHEFELVCRERDELNLACAGMRGALEGIDPAIWNSSCRQACNSSGPSDANCRVRQCLIRKSYLAVQAALSTTAGADTLAHIKGLEGLLREITQAPQRMQDMMRREGFAIDNLNDRWQKLAFTLYTEIVSMATEADACLKDSEQR